MAMGMAMENSTTMVTKVEFSFFPREKTFSYISWKKGGYTRMKAMKRVLATALTAAVVLGSANVASAAETQSPTTAPAATAQTKSVKVSGNTVKVKTTAKGTATVSAIKSTKKAVTVASTIKVNGVSYKVTVIGANAFKKCKKVKTVTIPATVVTISKNAFAGCKKLTKITLKGKKVTVKKGAFKGVNTKKVTIKASKMNAKQFKVFKKALKKAGFKGKVTK